MQARIAAGFSQTELASRLNTKPQQIQRYEATNYMGASVDKLIHVSRMLGVMISGMFERSEHAGGSIFGWGDADDMALGNFHPRK